MSSLLPPSAGRARGRMVLAASIAVVVASIGACSSTPTSTVTDGPPTDLGEVVDLRGQDPVSISIADNIYEPRAAQVDPGATISFRNDGANVHNATPTDEGSFAAISLAPTESGTVTVPTTPGTYRYFCTLHASKDSGLQRGAFVVG